MLETYTDSASGEHRGQPEIPDRTAPAGPQHVGEDHAGDAGQQARRGGQERRQRAGSHQRAQQLTERAAAESCLGQ
jgi:hypothetical protein